MLKLERIRLKDIRPDENNPRKDFGDLAHLAATFAYTPGRPGEPMNPIAVQHDGNVYRILDGERRFRAMAKAGQVDACTCLVAENADDVEAMLVMLATDDKRRLTADEMGRGIQQVMLLGVDEDTMAAVTNVDRKRLKSAGRGVRMLGRVTQLNLATLSEIGELESGEDVAAVEAALSKDPSDGWSAPWRVELRARLGRQRAEERRQGVAAALAEAGAECVQEDPAGVGWQFFTRADTASEVDGAIDRTADEAEERDCGWAVWLPPIEPNRWGDWHQVGGARFYLESAERESVPDERKLLRDEEVMRWDGLLEGFMASRFAFLVGLAADVNLMKLPASKELASRLWAIACQESCIESFEDEVGVKVAPCCGPLVVAMAWGSGLYEDFGPTYVADLLLGNRDVDERDADTIREWIGELEQLEGIGYEASEEELGLRGSFVEVLATYGAHGEDGAE